MVFERCKINQWFFICLVGRYSSFFQLSISLSRCAVRRLQVTRPGGLTNLGFDCTPFGLSLTVKGRTEIRAIILPPIFAKPLLHAGLLIIFYSSKSSLYLWNISFTFSPNSTFFICTVFGKYIC